MKKIILCSSIMFIAFCSISNESVASEPIKTVKVLKDLKLRLDQVNRISKYCYFDTNYRYMYKSPNLDYLLDFSTLGKSQFKGKTLTLKAGAVLNVYSRPMKTPRFPYLKYANGRFMDPEVYENQLTVLVNYSGVPAQPRIGDESYLSINLICKSESFKRSIFKNNDAEIAKVRTSYVNDLNENMSHYLEFDGQALLLQDEPEHY
jgi:hypothetical protein